MKPGEEMHADRGPRVGHPCNMKTVRATGKNALRALLTSWKNVMAPYSRQRKIGHSALTFRVFDPRMELLIFLGDCLGIFVNVVQNESFQFILQSFQFIFSVKLK